MAVGSNQRPQVSSVSLKRKVISEQDAAFEKARAEIEKERALVFKEAQMVRNDRELSSLHSVEYFEAKKEDALRKALAALKAGDKANFRILYKEAETYEATWKTAADQHAKLVAALQAEAEAGRRNMRVGLDEAARARMLETLEKRKDRTRAPEAQAPVGGSVLTVPRSFQKPDGKGGMAPLFPLKRAEIQRIAVSGIERVDTEDGSSIQVVQGRAPVAGVRLRDKKDFANLLRYIQTEQDEAGLAFAWTIVVTTVWRDLVGAAYRLAKNESDANTLAGATIAMAYETIGAFDVDREERKSTNMEASFAGWLIRASTRDFIDERKKLGKMTTDQRWTQDEESDGEFTSLFDEMSTEDQAGSGIKFDVRSSFGSILETESEDTVRDVKRVLRRISTELDSGREKVQAFKMWAFHDYKQDQIGAEFPTRMPDGKDKPLSRETVNKWIREVLIALRHKSPEFAHLCFEGEALVSSAKEHGPEWQQQRKAAALQRQAIRRGEVVREENPRRLRNPSFRHLPAALSSLLTKLTR